MLVRMGSEVRWRSVARLVSGEVFAFAFGAAVGMPPPWITWMLFLPAAYWAFDQLRDRELRGWILKRLQKRTWALVLLDSDKLLGFIVSAFIILLTFAVIKEDFERYLWSTGRFGEPLPWNRIVKIHETDQGRIIEIAAALVSVSDLQVGLSLSESSKDPVLEPSPDRQTMWYGRPNHGEKILLNWWGEDVREDGVRVVSISARDISPRVSFYLMPAGELSVCWVRSLHDPEDYKVNCSDLDPNN